MENLIFSLQATFPVFLIIVLGYYLGQTNFLTRDFCKIADKLVFKIALPAKLFLDMATVNFGESFPFSFVFFCLVTTLLQITGIWIGSRIFIKDKTIVGEFAQASYRSSAAILGMAIAQNMYGNAGMVPMMILACVAPYNIFAVLILTIENPENAGKKINYKKLLKDIATNPLILAVLVGTLYGLLPFGIPTIANKVLNNVSSIATPLALLSIGATFEGKKAIQRIAPTAAAAFLKLCGSALIFVPIAIMVGFRDQALVAILIMFCSPMTPSSYVMAKNMGHEGVLSASVIACTTLFSAVTLTIWIFVLRSMALIA